MAAADRQLPLLSIPLLILPAIHLLLCCLTALLSTTTPGGAWFRIIAIDPVCSLTMWRFDSNPALLAIFAIFGTAKWYVVGLLGWASKKGRIGSLGSAFAAVFCFLVGLVGVGLTKGQLATESTLSTAATVQYALVLTLCAGAFVSTAISAIAALKNASRHSLM